MVDLPVLRDRPVFICGHPKSGTSLLRNLLDSHPALVVYPEEAVFFRRFLKEAGHLDIASQIHAAESLLLHIFTWNLEHPPASQAGFPDRDYSAISFDAVRQHFRGLCDEHPPRHPGDLLAAAILSYGQVTAQLSDKTTAWVEKSPYNEYFTANIFKWWPYARCIHIVRDPRDNFASYQRKHGSWTAKFFATNWLQSTRRGLINAESYGPQRYLLLRYEDLVSKPDEVLNRICNYLEIGMDPGLFVPTRAGQGWQGNSMFTDRFSGITAAPVGRWKEKLPGREAAIISWITRSEMKLLKYEPAVMIPFHIMIEGSVWALRQHLYWMREGKRGKE